MRAIEGDRPLRDELLADPLITARLTAAEIDDLLAPEHYIGLTTTFVDRVLSASTESQR